MEIGWRSEQGKKTRDNRDCGGVGVRANGVLCLILDGSSSGPTSGDFAVRSFVMSLIGTLPQTKPQRQKTSWRNCAALTGVYLAGFRRTVRVMSSLI